MSEVHVEEHSSLIKTPQQLIVVVLLAFLIPVIGIVMIASFATGGLRVDSRSPDASATAVAERLQPVGTVVIGEVPAEPTAGTPAVKSASGGAVKTAAAGGAGAGKKLYDTVCMACHAAGIAGAPKTGDKAAWKPRIASGKEALYNSALHGKNAMPAKGGLASAPDVDVKAAVDYLVSLAK
ncbi:MAG: cytochrome c5 family protein [Betaproteobacteria bacterium]|nr:cytochrome c5 family protein [Betaproteobacteria bacterium]